MGDWRGCRCVSYLWSMYTRLCTALLLAATTVFAQTPDPLKLVDPFIGTGPEGHTFPGAAAPFGMVQLSPDTQIRPFKQSYKWAAGYRYEDATILGFSHTHFSGAGHSDLGDVLLTPLIGENVPLEPGEPGGTQAGYRHSFSHASEHAEPGYYSVSLDGGQIRAELTASERVGVHRYTFAGQAKRHLLLDLRSSIYNYPGKVLWSRVRIRKDGTISGMRETRGWAPGRQLYFAMRFSVPVSGHSLYNREENPPPYHGFKSPGNSPQDTQSIEGRGLEAAFDFAPSSEPLVVKVSLSPVSEENAIANMDAEVSAFDFDATRAQTQQLWRTELGRAEFLAAPAMEKSLYTALYHSMLAPSTSMDVNGEYRGPDNQVHRAEGFRFVSSLSLWDTYRAEQPLMTLLEPEQRTNDLVKSLIASQQESPFGILPVWQFAGIETWCMIGYHSLPIIADAYMKGIRGYDVQAALDAMVASATYAPYGNLGAYMKLGYVPVDHDSEAASKTVEYAFDDWTLARMAKAMGNEAVAATFLKRSGYWRNNFNVADGFIEPRLADGAYSKPFDPAKAGADSGFTEGNAWQYSWYQPQDEQGLIDLLGGNEKLVAKLDAMFDQKVDMSRYADVEDISGMIGQYIHGNEPSHHLAYLYMYAAAQLKTQARLKQIVDSQYKPSPDGLVGNDDLGQMSAWLVFTSLGFYPVAPGSNQYVLGRPFVDRAVLHLPSGKSLTISSIGMSDAQAFLKDVQLNGRTLDRSYVTHEELMQGGELKFVFSSEKDAAWSHRAILPPYSETKSR
jgi:predicted alpha-1,2-mannosidase